MRAGLSIASIGADMINHRGDVGPEFGKKLGDFGKPQFEGIKARPQGGTRQLLAAPRAAARGP